MKKTILTLICASLFVGSAFAQVPKMRAAKCALPALRKQYNCNAQEIAAGKKWLRNVSIGAAVAALAGIAGVSAASIRKAKQQEEAQPSQPMRAIAPSRPPRETKQAPSELTVANIVQAFRLNDPQQLSGVAVQLSNNPKLLDQVNQTSMQQINRAAQSAGALPGEVNSRAVQNLADAIGIYVKTRSPEAFKNAISRARLTSPEAYKFKATAESF